MGGRVTSSTAAESKRAVSWAGHGWGHTAHWRGRGAGMARAWRGHGAGMARAWRVTPGAGCGGSAPAGAIAGRGRVGDAYPLGETTLPTSDPRLFFFFATLSCGRLDRVSVVSPHGPGRPAPQRLCPAPSNTDTPR
eukprot:gene22562-biopygen4248